MPRIGAVIIDDHPLVLEGIRNVFAMSRQIAVLGSVRSLAEAENLLRKVSPEVVVVDLNLPDSSGVATLTRIKGVCPYAKLVAITASSVCEAEMRRKGADACLDKTCAAERIVQIVVQLFPARKDNTVHPTLGTRELEIIRLVAEGLSNPEIGNALYISPNTVKTHLSHVFCKLKLRNRVDLARWWDSNEDVFRDHPHG